MTICQIPDFLTPGRTKVMGIINVTPDSFSDGGAWFNPEKAIAHALELEAAGADILDIGGESTRPGAESLSPAQEQRRVLPVISGYLKASRSPVPISLDTVNAETAAAGLAAGVQIINDISGGTLDAGMLKVMAENDAYYICQHMRGNPKTMDSLCDYGGDVTGGVCQGLKERIHACEKAGVNLQRLILDPGLGFAKSAEQSWELLGNLEQLEQLGYPLLIGASRKRFLEMAVPAGWEDSLPAGVKAGVGRREDATTAVSALCAQAGVWAVRVHNVAASASAVAAGQLWREAACR
ncbi:dihydropteroate synthase [Varibaculum cambriense]|uniref:dihydropteroate synthase n=1 Tax=Varibaculum cambriense TaxID=184870 RepID=UPI0003B43CE5|nr:dihydropteroate synthase [Varibaculum cambriense]